MDGPNSAFTICFVRVFDPSNQNYCVLVKGQAGGPKQLNPRTQHNGVKILTKSHRMTKFPRASFFIPNRIEILKDISKNPLGTKRNLFLDSIVPNRSANEIPLGGIFMAFLCAPKRACIKMGDFFYHTATKYLRTW